MNISERLKEAYENVSFSADSTWAQCRSEPYHESNLELYLTERHLRKLKTNRPRSVRECIPRSRLATYGDYEYNESREMSYASESSSVYSASSNYCPSSSVSECWENPEIDGLFGWYTSDHHNFTLKDTSYESPLLNAYGFEDRIMKVHLTENLVKEIWKNDKHSLNETGFNSNDFWEDTLDIYMSPLKRFFFGGNNNCMEVNHECRDRNEWFRNISVTKDFEQLVELSEFFRVENVSISKSIVMDNQENVSSPSAPELTGNTEILYSEVLQGLLPIKKLVKTVESSKSGRIIGYSSRDVEKLSKNTKPIEVAPSIKATRQFIEPAFNPMNTKSTSNKGNSECTFSRWTTQRQQQYHLMDPLGVAANQRQSSHRSSGFVQPSSYVHQTYLHSPLVPTFQRWIAPNLVQNSAPTHHHHQWYCQPNPIESSALLSNFYSGGSSGAAATGLDLNLAAVNNLRRALEITEFKGFYSNNSKYDEVVMTERNKSDDSVIFEEHPVSASISEELEIQALEQYQSSNENFYQDLERQATEQYRNNPE